MRFVLAEQEEMMNDFDDPVEFVRAYTNMYIRQRDVPVKVYLDDIVYYRKFESMFLDVVLKRSLSADAPILNFPEVESLLFEFRNREFYDKRFYLESTLILIKGIAILVDRVDQEVQRHEFSNVRYLYYYTTQPVDLTRVLVEACSSCVKQIDRLVKSMSELRNTVSYINKQLEGLDRSFLADDKRLKDRMDLSDRILGMERVEKYSVDGVYGRVFDLVADAADKMEASNGYLYVMEFCSEYLTAELGQDDSIARLKEYSTSLLKRMEE